jgi:hypothetical protein
MLAGTGSGAVASHRSAAVIHGLDLLGRLPAGVVELTHPRGIGSKSGRGGARMHTAALPDGHTAMCRGVPVTSVPRTIIDIARVSSFPAAVVTADSALRGRRVSKAELQAVIAACPRWPGIGRARAAAAFADGRSETALESLARALFHQHGLPAPELQVLVGDDEIIARVDFLWSGYRTVGEADGALKYSSQQVAVAQLRRDARLRDAGFEIVHFTWEEILRAPDEVVATLRRAFHRGAVRRPIPR